MECLEECLAHNSCSVNVIVILSGWPGAYKEAYACLAGWGLKDGLMPLFHWEQGPESGHVGQQLTLESAQH